MEELSTDQDKAKALHHLVDSYLSNSLAPSEVQPDAAEKYRVLRDGFVNDEWFEKSGLIPDLLRNHKTLAGIAQQLWSENNAMRANPSAEWQGMMYPLIDQADDRRTITLDASGVIDLSGSAVAELGPVPSEQWTGVKSRAQLLSNARALLPGARDAIAVLIDGLSKPGHNGGPAFEDRIEALDSLRQLHSTIGTILEFVDKDDWDLSKVWG